jgi:hypothetical protein
MSTRNRITLAFVALAGVALAAQTGSRILAGVLIEKAYFPAAICQNATAVSQFSLPVTNPAVAACVTGTNTQRGVLDFADGANSLSAQLSYRLPSDFSTTLTGVDVNVYWHSATTTNNVVWQTQTICVADAETADPAFNTADAFAADAAKGTTLQLNTASDTNITLTGCAAGEMLYLKILRDPAHASDTHAATARLEGVELVFRRLITGL